MTQSKIQYHSINNNQEIRKIDTDSLTRVSRYQIFSILDFIGAKDEGHTDRWTELLKQYRDLHAVCLLLQNVFSFN